jgi:prevent-host-death family protein
MEIAAGKFKSQCLHLMDLVATTDIEVVITKRGKPVARLVRPEVKKKKLFFGCMKGTIDVTGDILEPSGPEQWEATQE